MACLGAVAYDPAGAIVSKATSSLLAMTAFDTTNARITFTAPSNGSVLVKIRVPNKGASTSGVTLLGVLDGATVRGRCSPNVGRQGGTATLKTAEAVYLVTGLTPTTSYTFDAAYGVELVQASSAFVYGGPNNTTLNDAAGALVFEVWETPNLLAGTFYDPGTAAGPSTASLLAMTAIDTTNLRLNFTVPASGKVHVRLRCVSTGSTTVPNMLLGVLESSTVKMRQAPLGGHTNVGTLAATDHTVLEAHGVVSGLTPSASLTWDAAYGVETAVASQVMRYGGPNDTTITNAYGGIAFEVWSA